MREDYIYAVARVRAMEGALLSDAAIGQLAACGTYGQCVQFLAEKGWGDVRNGESGENGEAILAREEEKTWERVKELAVPMEAFDVLTWPKLFHNLKAAIKEACAEAGMEVCAEGKVRGIFYEDVRIPGGKMREIVREKDFERLPEPMREAAAEAYEALLRTGDGQRCDVILDRGALEAVREAGRAAEDAMLREYAEFQVAIADVKIAVRSEKTGKSLEFMRRAMAECKSLDAERLARAALGGMDGIREYLSGTAYAGGADPLGQSPGAFERWCDNRIIQMIRPQKYKPFGIGPVAAYVIARQNEIKTARIILSGKRNHLPDALIRERIREMYV